jgi:hypothetical protein
MRHENGNCIPAGGFCTANKNICEALLNAYRMGKAQLSQEGTTFDLISRTETVKQLQGVLDVTVPITDYDGGYVDGVEVGVSTVSTMPPAQPELIEKTAYIRGFEQGRTQGMIDSQGGRNE